MREASIQKAKLIIERMILGDEPVSHDCRQFIWRYRGACFHFDRAYRAAKAVRELDHVAHRDERVMQELVGFIDQELSKVG